jgi:hypothetical protein
MTRKPVDIKVVVAAGVPTPDAIKAALPGTAVAFADRHGFPKTHVSMCIYGRGRYEAVRAALAEELQVEREWLDELLDGMRPAARDSGEYLVLHRELLAPYDADREAVEMALPPGLVVLDERPMELRDGETGGTTCYRIGPRPEPAPEEACA